MRSNLQAAILSLSFFAWRCRETTFRPPCLMILLWIAPTALASDRKHRKWVIQSVHRWFSSRRQLFDCLAHGVAEIAQPLPAQSSVEGDADIGAGQTKLGVIHLVGHRVLGVLQTCIRSMKTQGGAHHDHCEDNADGAKNCLCRRDA